MYSLVSVLQVIKAPWHSFTKLAYMHVFFVLLLKTGSCRSLSTNSHSYCGPCRSWWQVIWEVGTNILEEFTATTYKWSYTWVLAVCNLGNQALHFMMVCSIAKMLFWSCLENKAACKYIVWFNLPHKHKQAIQKWYFELHVIMNSGVALEGHNNRHVSLNTVWIPCLLTYLLHGAESFLSSWLACS
jgi:hypothetical protein